MIKKYISFFCLTALLMGSVTAQEFKSDDRPQTLKEDSDNEYRSDSISNLDLLEALEFNGIRIRKYDLGKFDKKYDLYFFVDEYTNGEFTSSDTIMISDNTYDYYLEEEDDGYYIDFIDQVKVISKLGDGILKLKFNTYAHWFFHDIKLEVSDERQFFNTREYEVTEWKLNKKVPLFIIASSWLDAKHDFYRFCAVTTLRENDKGTNLLLERSPKYYVINYKVEEFKE